MAGLALPVGLSRDVALRQQLAEVYTGFQSARHMARIAQRNPDGPLQARAVPMLGGIDPDVGEVMRRFGSMQVRAAGTVGGSIANASPIGDLAPMLIALGAAVELRRGDDVRQLPLEKIGPEILRLCRQPHLQEA